MIEPYEDSDEKKILRFHRNQMIRMQRLMSRTIYKPNEIKNEGQKPIRKRSS